MSVLTRENEQNGSSRITDEINKTAHSEAEAAVRSAKRVAEREIEAAERKAEERQQDLTARLRTNVEKRRRTAEARARGEAASILLHKRSELLERVLRDALERLREMPRDAEYLELLKRHAVEGAKALRLRRNRVRCNEKDRAFLQAESRFEQVIQHVRDATGEHVELEMADTPHQAAGGLVLESEDGRVSYHMTFEDTVERKRDVLLAIAGGKLFHEVRPQRTSNHG